MDFATMSVITCLSLVSLFLFHADPDVSTVSTAS